MLAVVKRSFLPSQEAGNSKGASKGAVWRDSNILYQLYSPVARFPFDIVRHALLVFCLPNYKNVPILRLNATIIEVRFPGLAFSKDRNQQWHEAIRISELLLGQAVWR
jgi:hypothetical protein